MLPRIIAACCLILFSAVAYPQPVKCAWKPNPFTTIKNVSDVGSHRQALQKALRQREINADSTYTLPVVVHVIHTGTQVGAPDNPADSLIKAMLQGLNNAWRKNGLNYGGADMNIQFKLAAKSPQCTPTTGITRTNGSAIPNYISGGITNYDNPLSAPEATVKMLSLWPNTDYINIWIVTKINGDVNFPGGYAYFPELNAATTDGIVLNASVVSGDNKTIAHEMGHVFSLFHTFADGAFEDTCAANIDCANQGDHICDTEPCLYAYDCSSSTNSCTGLPFAIADVEKNYTVLNNYMGYTDCQWMFTAQQKIRVRSALETFRSGLLSSGAFNTAANALPATACAVTAVHGLSPYYGVQKVDFNSLHVYSNSSKADGSTYIDRTCNQSTIVEKGTTYHLTVTGSYTNPHRIKVFIDYNGNGLFTDVDEIVLSAYDGIAETDVTIPMSGVVTNMPLRMRVVADNPALPEPTACQLTGTVAEGGGQAEDYSVVIVPRQIYSRSSGNWNDAVTWSCNCVPNGDDQVTIKANTTVTITAEMGNLQCGKLKLEATSVFNQTGNVLSIGNGN